MIWPEDVSKIPSDNKSSASYKYTYDDNGLCIEKSEAYGDKPPVCTTTYYYNASGLCEKEVQVFNDGNSQSWVYTYDSAGRISTETFFGVNGTKVKSSDNTYDAVGNCENASLTNKVFSAARSNSSMMNTETQLDILGRISTLLAQSQWKTPILTPISMTKMEICFPALRMAAN